MREKSSKVFTSFKSRWPLRRMMVKSSRFSAETCALRLCQNLIEGPQHERERRAKLVAHVGEKRRLGAVELGQRFSTFAFFLVGACTGKSGGDLTRQQINESAVGCIKGSIRVDSRDQKARWAILTLLSDWKNDRLPSGFVPGPGGDGSEARSEIVHGYGCSGREKLWRRPYLIFRVEIDDYGRNSIAGSCAMSAR